MELLGDVGPMESRFGPFGGSVCFGDVGHLESHLGPFGEAVSVRAR
jgi:hypothetical protein